MSDKFYGWIGNTKQSLLQGKRDKQTITSKFIIYYAKKSRAKEAENNGSKNLLEYNDKYYYVLSIRKGSSIWAPYPFIDDLDKPVILILTQDTDEGCGNIWRFEYDDKVKGELDRQSRDNAGDYYSLPLGKVREKAGNGVNFDLTDENSMMKIMGEILK